MTSRPDADEEHPHPYEIARGGGPRATVDHPAPRWFRSDRRAHDEVTFATRNNTRLDEWGAPA